ncbi:MAG: serine hydrolase [Pseudomonadota bacterium]
MLAISAFFIWLVPVGAAYTAKMMCSAIFVSRLSSERALREDVLADNNPVLSLITANVDLRHQRVHAHAFGFRTRIAVYRPHLGCTLSTREQADALQNNVPVIRQIATEPLQTAALPQNIDGKKLNDVLSDAMDEPGSHPSRRSRAIVVLHQGKVIAERYDDGITVNTPLPGWSMTKSVFNILLGRMRHEGILPSLDTPVLINEWRGQPADPRNAITYDNLLSMTGGLAFDESYWNPLSDVVQMLFTQPSAAAFAVSRPQEHAPGTIWAYNSGTTNILSAAMRNLTGSTAAYQRLPYELLFRPLGMNRAVIETDSEGYFVGSSYMLATAREWGKIGQFFLQDGIWEGQRLLPEGWVTHATTSAPAANGVYGAHWWLQLPGADDDTPQIPDDTYFALGHDGQSLTVIPSKDLVIVRLGLTRNRESFVLRDFVAGIAAAVPDRIENEVPSIDIPQDADPSQN